MLAKIFYVIFLFVFIAIIFFSNKEHQYLQPQPQPPIEVNNPMPLSNVKRLALVIGNSDYQFIPALSNPVNDAKDVAAALDNLGYEVIVLTNASYKAMIDAVQQFGERLLDLGFVGLFYFSGHGLQSGGKNYLIPVDAKIKTEADIKPLSLDANHVLAKMNEAKALVNVMILDACRDNPFKQAIIKSLSSKGLAHITAPSGTFISFATAPLKPAWGGKENERNSIYTKYLLAALKYQTNVSISDVFIELRNQVMLETKDAEAQQVPWDTSSLRHQFCFAECSFDSKVKLPELVVTPLSPVQDDKNINFTAILNPLPLQELKRDMFEKTVEFKKRVKQYHEHRLQLFDESLAKFNKAGMDGDKRYQAGIVYLTKYDADKEIFDFEIKLQAGWVKQIFSDLSYQGQKWIVIPPVEAKALWQAGKQKPLFLIVKRSGDHSVVTNVILRGEKKAWDVGNFKEFRAHGEFRDSLKDGGFGPKMVWISAGTFRMGDIQADGDKHEVSVGRFAMGKYEVTFAEYDLFAEATGRTKPDDNGWGRDNNPVINVSWNDATAYTKWLSDQTGKTYRLPTEAEWDTKSAKLICSASWNGY
jgi:hypothetical protein